MHRPEIARTHLANAILQLKGMGLSDVAAIEWLDPPSSASLRSAVRQLYLLGALDENGALTARGGTMARLPVEPCLARTLLAAHGYGCLPAACTMCAMASGVACVVSGAPDAFGREHHA